MTTPEEVQAWRENHKLPRRGFAPQSEGTLQARLLAGQVAKVEEEARAKRMKNELLAGKLYEADEVERDVAELTSLIRCRLESIPDELSMEFPDEHRVALTQRLKDQIHLILTQMSQWRLSSWPKNEAEEDEDADGEPVEESAQ